MSAHSLVALAAGAACCVLLGGHHASAGAKDITLPPDSVQLTPSPLPGYAKARVHCVACHSAEYMVYQPPNAPRPYWDAMVKRMKAVFNAPINDADMPEIIDYLARTYGSEQPTK